MSRRSDQKEKAKMKIALASCLAPEERLAAATGPAYGDWQLSSDWVVLLHARGFLDTETAKLALEYIDNFADAEGRQHFSDKLDPISLLAALSMAEGYETEEDDITPVPKTRFIKTYELLRRQHVQVEQAQ